jgi:hypothetical protein
MNKSFDLLISRYLKSWAGQHRPPVDARARLLWEAAHQSQGKTQRLPVFPRPQFNAAYPPGSEEWSQTLFLWVSEHSFQAGLQARLG